MCRIIKRGSETSVTIFRFQHKTLQKRTTRSADNPKAINVFKIVWFCPLLFLWLRRNISVAIWTVAHIFSTFYNFLFHTWVGGDSWASDFKIEGCIFWQYKNLSRNIFDWYETPYYKTHVINMSYVEKTSIIPAKWLTVTQDYSMKDPY